MKVEGTVSGKHGFVAAVPEVLEYGRGAIREGTGFATFKVKYYCIVMRPVKGEVMDCVVTSVNKVGKPAIPPLPSAHVVRRGYPQALHAQGLKH